MGILTDFVVAPPDSGARIGASVNPAKSWPTVQSKGADTIKIAKLYGVIAGKPYSDELMNSFALVGGNQDDGPWVFVFPTEIRDELAALPDSRVADVAKAWCATEELQLDRWTTKDAESFVRELTAHARLARKSGYTMYLWVSL